MFLIGFSVSASAQMISPILAIYANDYLGASIYQVGLIVSSFYISSFVSELSVGIFSGRRRVGLLLASGLLGVSVFPFAYALVGDSLSLVAIRILHGSTSCLFYIASMTIASTMVPYAKRDETLGIFTAALALGMMAGPFIGTLGVALLGVRNTFFLASSVASLGFVSSFPLLRRFRSTSEAEHSGIPRKNLVAVFSNGLFRRAFLAFFAWAFLFGVILAYAPLYAHKILGFPDEQITALFFGYYTFTAGVRLLMNKLTRRFGKEKLLVFGLVGSTVITLLMALGGSPTAFAVAFVLLGMAQGIVYPTSAMIAAGAFGLEELLLANSILLSASDLGQTLGPVFGSVLAENYGIPYALSISSIPAALAGILVVRIRSPERE